MKPPVPLLLLISAFPACASLRRGRQLCPWLAVALCVGGSFSAFPQGSLTPPTGTPAPTMKTLDQIEARTPISSLPFTISNSGSYYLAKNLSALPEQGGIVINASDVTLDLNGFTLYGTLGAEGSHGITVGGFTGNITIKNGSINNWKGRGVSTGSTIPNCRFFDLRIRDAGAEGLVGGVRAMVERCTVFSSVAAGIVVGDNSSVKDCVSSANRGDGIQTGTRSVVMNCLADGNIGNGITVIAACRVIGNHCTNNTDPDSLGAGISAGGGRTYVEGNTCINNDRGIVAVGGMAVKNVASGNSFTDFNYGMFSTVSGETFQADSAVVDETVSAWANFSIIDP